jgi:GTP:adenosylcobinamide-phosphate guanylyltransferase
MVDCVILAGGINKELDKPEEVHNKALIKIGDKEIVRYVLEVYRQVEEIGRIALVGPVENFAFLKNDFSVELVQESDSILQNLIEANCYLQSKNHLLISTADIPLINPPAVKDFLEKCLPYDYDFYYPIVSKEDSEKKFPGVKRTYVNFQEGTFTGGNIFLVNPDKIEPSVPIVRQFIEYRKKPMKMVSLLGTGFVLRVITKKVTIPQVEKRFSSLLNVKAKAIISDYAEIGFDVDKPSDLELVRQVIVCK